MNKIYLLKKYLDLYLGLNGRVVGSSLHHFGYNSLTYNHPTISNFNLKIMAELFADSYIISVGSNSLEHKDMVYYDGDSVVNMSEELTNFIDRWKNTLGCVMDVRRKLSYLGESVNISMFLLKKAFLSKGIALSRGTGRYLVFNLGQIEYQIQFDGYSDIVVKLSEKYNLMPYQDSPVGTINFAKNFDNLVLSEGTFSWWMGFLSKEANIYYPKGKVSWHGDIFVFDEWCGVDI
jgi:hypothetical protein